VGEGNRRASAQVEAVCERALSALAAVLEDARGRWLLYGPGEAELPVTGLWNGRAESIVIDRVRIDEEGTHWIVDYKGSTHEGGDLEGFLRQEAERYRPQLTKYAALYRHLPGVPPERVRTALYFPLLREFREITPEDI
jgi:ATP-dependent helicase/nuclease subunit A